MSKTGFSLNRVDKPVKPMIKNIKPLGFQWETQDPFLFCVHHEDAFPKGNEKMGPATSLQGRDIGQDFILKDGWRMYHGKTVPGFPGHPHRGFETITIVRKGMVDHSDSLGASGRYGNGDVQWMTAASGVVHEEFHSKTFTESGGIFEMVQLWVNLPAKLKMTAPRYQQLLGSTFPTLQLGSARARLIAGSLLDKHGPAKTHSPITMFDMEFTEDGEATFALDEGTTTLLFMLRGDATVQDGQRVSSGELVVFDRSTAGSIRLAAENGARALILNGEPLNEPVVAHGPFVMNTKAEIAQAMRDYQNGKMGQLPLKESAG